MSSGSYMQVYVCCPFYRRDDGKNRIVCEGVGDSSNLTWYFRRKCELQTQMQVFCCQHYENARYIVPLWRNMRNRATVSFTLRKQKAIKKQSKTQ